MRFLNVGDLHGEAKDLKTSAFPNFMHSLPDLAREHRCEAIAFLGDLCHTHDVLNSFVQHFYRETFEWYGEHPDLSFAILIGNHDQASVMSPLIHALSAFKMPRNVKVWDRPGYSETFKSVMMPYMHDNDEFVREAEALRMKFNADNLLCHQTYQGACFENKFMAAGGVDATRLGFKRIISGHIHMRQEFGVVHYTGTPRWKTASDYNEPKSLSVFDTVSGEIELIDSAKFFVPWRRYKESQNEVTLQTIPITPETEVVIEGDQEFVAARAQHWSSLGVRVRSRVVGKKVTVSVNSGKAIGQLLSDYVDTAPLHWSSDRTMVKEILGRYL